MSKAAYLLNIGGQWKQFRGLFLNPDAPPAELKAIEVAFYSGAQSIVRLEESLTDAIQRRQISMHSAQAIKEFWRDELRRWAGQHLEERGKGKQPQEPGEEAKQ